MTKETSNVDEPAETNPSDNVTAEPVATASHTATHTTTHTTKGEDPEGYDARKQTIINQLEQSTEVYEKPQKPLDEAIKKQQDKEKDVFNNLIKENVAVDRERRKVVEQLQESRAQNEVLKVEMDIQKEKVAELEAQIKNMETEMKKLVIAARKQGVKKRTSNLSTEGPKGPDAEENNNEEEEEDEEKKKSNQTRIRELQFRLLRMTTDMEEKDRQTELREKEMEELKSYSEELERFVEANKLAEIKTRRRERQEQSEEKKQDRANVVKQSGGATNSKICTIM